MRVISSMHIHMQHSADRINTLFQENVLPLMIWLRIETQQYNETETYENLAGMYGGWWRVIRQRVDTPNFQLYKVNTATR